MGYGSVNTPSMNLGVLAPNAAAHVVDVEVDPDTGKVELLRYTAFQDVGLSVNPDQVEGQVQGGVAQGIGWALHEEYDFDESGVSAQRDAARLPAADVAGRAAHRDGGP